VDRADRRRIAVSRPIRAAAAAAALAALAAACANPADSPTTPPSGTPIASAPPADGSVPPGTGSAPASTSTPVPAGMDNGVAALSAADILDKAQAALLQAQSVRIRAIGGANGSGFTADVSVQAHKGGAGTLNVPGGAGGQTLAVQVVTLGSVAYVKGDAAAWQKILGRTPSVPDIGSKWVKAGADNIKLKTLVSLADLAPIATGILALDNNVGKGATSTVDGTPAVAVTGAGPSDATIYVATTGQPYPLKIVQGGSTSGELDLTGFDQPVDVTAPPAADTIEATQLGL
jgi:hypothetical protein